MIRLEAVAKSYAAGPRLFEAVAPTSLHIARGEVFGIIGFSGAGKSTLLRLINLLERPSSGAVWVGGQRLDLLDAVALRQARRRIGMIFQQFNLLHNRNALDNVGFPLRIAGLRGAAVGARARECLDIVGLADKAAQYPAQLSGGQKQRVAIARALATQPQVLLCDEPTSALDPHTTRELLAVLRDINQRLGVTIVIVSHSLSVVRALCGRVAVMEGGHVVEELALRRAQPPEPRSAAARRLFEAA